MQCSRFILLVNAKLSERVSSKSGRRVDETVPSDGDYVPPLAGRVVDVADFARLPSAAGSMTRLATEMIRSMFDSIQELRAPKLDRFEMSGETVLYKCTFLLALTSSSSSAGGTEGSDLMFAAVLEADKPRELQESNIRTTRVTWGMARTPLGAKDTLTRLVPETISGPILARAKQVALAMEWADSGAWGIDAYVVPFELDERVDQLMEPNWKNDETERNEHVSAVGSQQIKMAITSIAAYLNYVRLICVRAERQLLQLNFSGNWERESKKLLLVRKRLAIVRRYAELTNRGEPESVLTHAFATFSKTFRLQSQLERLSRAVEEYGRAFDLQNAYIALKRARAIEIILLSSLISAVVAVGVGLNTIQMPPFYESTTTNALTRPEFWSSLVAAILVVGLLAFALVRLFDWLGHDQR